MNINKFTQNSLQAVQNCEKVAYEYGNQEIEQEHLLYALVTQEESLILKLLEKMNIHKEVFINRVPPITLMQRSSFAPVLSATLSLLSC